MSGEMKLAFRRMALLVASLGSGVLLQGGLVAAAGEGYSQGKWLSRVLLWNMELTGLVDKLGYRPIMGHRADGSPIYEGTPVTLLCAMAGLVLGVAIYSYAAYALLRSRFDPETGTKTGTKRGE